MKIVFLGSSSSGNSTYIELNNKRFLIDVGFSFKYIEEKLNEIDVEASSLDFILITHSHLDHIKSLYTFYRKNIDIYLPKQTFNELPNKEKYNGVYFIDDIDNIEGLTIKKIPISHDVFGYGYVIENGNESICYITDTGLIYSKYFNIMKNKNVYLIESNHDPEMEMNGNKNLNTKLRNIGDEGHLSNEQCKFYLQKLVGNNTKVIALMHISKEDNTYELAYNETRKSIDEKIKIHVTSAEESTTIDLKNK